MSITSTLGATDATSALAGANNSATTSATQGAKAMDKEAFLKLLVAQISNQDPLKPMEGTEFVSQLSQFALVEQSLAQSKSLGTVSTQLTGLGNAESASLAGKTVTVKGKNISFDGVSPTMASATLDGAATKVTATVRDANGNAVRKIEIGATPPGAVRVSWDGKTDQGEVSPTGNYTVEFSAEGTNGSTVNVTQSVRGMVKRVSFEKGYPELELDSGVTAPVSNLLSVEVT